MKPISTKEFRARASAVKNRVVSSIDGEVIQERLRALVESPSEMLRFQQTCIALSMACGKVGDTPGHEAANATCEAAIHMALANEMAVEQLKKEGLL